MLVSTMARSVGTGTALRGAPLWPTVYVAFMPVSALLSAHEQHL
jgi:hypothetical protein